MIVLVAAALLLCPSTARHVQSQSAEQNPLAQAKALTCTFKAAAAAAWNDDESQPHVEAREIPIQMSLEIDSINTDEGTAHVGAGSDSTILLTASSLHILETSTRGNLTITSVFSRERPKGRYSAVRSQHDYLPIGISGMVIKPTVVQYYGSCAVVR